MVYGGVRYATNDDEASNRNQQCLGSMLAPSPLPLIPSLGACWLP